MSWLWWGIVTAAILSILWRVRRRETQWRKVELERVETALLRYEEAVSAYPLAPWLTAPDATLSLILDDVPMMLEALGLHPKRPSDGAE